MAAAATWRCEHLIDSHTTAAPPAEMITGQKRAWEPGAPPEGQPPEAGAEDPAAAPASGEPTPAAAGGEPEAKAAAPTGSGEDPAALSNEAAWLRQQNSQLQQQLSALQQQHAQLMQQQQMGGGPPPAYGAQRPMGGQAAPARPHNPQWTEQHNPENGQTYYWNSATGESTYTRPADYNPPGAAAGGGGGALGPLPQVKGPPGANLFIVRKMRRGEYDTFLDDDLRREFSKYGTVTRAEMTMDKTTGWSKGYGFVSFSQPAEAEAALAAVHGSWMDGREMKVEKTKEDGC